VSINWSVAIERPVFPALRHTVSADFTYSSAQNPYDLPFGTELQFDLRQSEHYSGDHAAHSAIELDALGDDDDLEPAPSNQADVSIWQHELAGGVHFLKQSR